MNRRREGRQPSPPARGHAGGGEHELTDDEADMEVEDDIQELNRQTRTEPGKPDINQTDDERRRGCRVPVPIGKISQKSTEKVCLLLSSHGVIAKAGT